jgi:hypothetical protein
LGISWTKLKVEFDWRLKQRLTWSMPVMKRPLKSPDKLLDTFSEAQRARHAELSANYDLSTWSQVCDRLEYLRSLHTLDVCDQHLRDLPVDVPQCLDIGAREWSYFPALAAFRPGPWQGVELDAHQRYLTLSTRAAYARFMASPYEGTNYVSGSLTKIEGRFGLITWFLPYVTLAPLDAFQLPRRFFEPERLLLHAWQLLAPGGTLYVENQKEEEAAIQKELFESLDIPAQVLGQVFSIWTYYDEERFGFRATKPGSL